MSSPTGTRLELVRSAFLRGLVPSLALVAVYLPAGIFGLRLAIIHPSASAVWPPSGIALAALLLFGYRVWPGILLGAFLVNAWTAGSLATSIAIAVGNTLEGLVGAYLVNRFARGRNAFERAQDYFRFVVLAAMLSTTVSASFGVTSLSLAGYAAWRQFGPIWLTWWLGDAVGDLVVAPFLILLAGHPRGRWNRARAFEVGVLLLALLLVGQTVFGGPFFHLKDYPLTFMCMPILVWVAFRLGRLEAAAAVLMLAGIAVWGTSRGFGPFLMETRNQALVLLQSFMGVTAFVTMALATLVAERGRTEESLRSLEKAVESVPIGVTVTDVGGKILYTNPAEPQMHGYTVEELIGKEARTLVPSEFWRPLTREQIRGLGAWKRERTNVRKDGSTFPAQLISDVVKDRAGEAVAIVTTCEDITERKKAEDRLVRHAFYDGLTGLPNRALFMERLGQAFSRSKRRPDSFFAVLFLDLDRFKLVNDSLGHLLGDQLLAAITRRLQPSLRPGDTMARLGGDEFAILVEDMSHETDATRVADRVLKELAAPFGLDGQELFMSASIGIAMSTAGYERPEDILRDADTAMYRAKAQGKARYETFDASMRARAATTFLLEADLRRAVERQEFAIHYQPIVLLKTGKIMAFEALLRWQHPERGLLLPGEFLAVAEETGLIVPIGEWVLRASCAQAQAWRAKGAAPEFMTVNLSARQFKQRDLCALVAQTLVAAGRAPEELGLELSEAAVMEDVEQAVSTLGELKRIGVRVAIDDFGTGHSSLSQLKRFPIDHLKIGRSFVRNITTDPTDAAIVASIITLAHRLYLTVIAEGVETEDQLRYLRAHGCDAVQGYRIGTPTPKPSLSPRQVL